MSSTAELFLKATLVGVGGTIVLDLYALMMSRVLGVPATNWAMVGRWFGNMAHGQFVQVAMSEAVPVKGELAIGWIAHYAIGIGYGLLLLGLWGKVWLELMGHSVFGLGMYATGRLLAPYWPTPA
jgi:Protein of unknown function (DUF2938)